MCEIRRETSPMDAMGGPAGGAGPALPFSLSSDEEEDDLWGETGRKAEGGERCEMAEEEDWEEEERDGWEAEEGEEAEAWEEEDEPQAAPVGGDAVPAPLAASVAVTSASRAAVVVAPSGTMVAALPAPWIWSRDDHERAIQRLRAALAGLPARTLLVDLRQHPPTPRSRRRVSAPAPSAARSRSLGLTKAWLRTEYGAGYWDRGASLLTVWKQGKRVVDLPRAAAGIEELVEALRRGFSLLLLDSVPRYAESARAAVLAELRRRLPDLVLGPCS